MMGLSVNFLKRPRGSAFGAVFALVSLLFSAAIAEAPPAGKITLRASNIEISAEGIKATGSPELSSDQGAVSGQVFDIKFDRSGKAASATAIGGVHFSLRARTGPYTTAAGTCD